MNEFYINEPTLREYASETFPMDSNSVDDARALLTCCYSESAGLADCRTCRISDFIDKQLATADVYRI